MPAVRRLAQTQAAGGAGGAICGGLAGTARIHDSGAQLAFAVRGARHRHDDARPRHRVRRGQDQADRPFRHAAGGRHPAQADESQTRRRAVAARAGPPHQAYGGAVRRAHHRRACGHGVGAPHTGGRSDGYRRFPFGRPDWSQGLHHPDSGVHLARSAVFQRHRPAGRLAQRIAGTGQIRLSGERVQMAGHPRHRQHVSRVDAQAGRLARPRHRGRRAERGGGRFRTTAWRRRSFWGR